MKTNGEKDGAVSVILLFDSTHAALAAEEQIITGEYWCDMVPRPPGTADSLCGLAVAIKAADEAGIAGLLQNAGIVFDTYREDGQNG